MKEYSDKTASYFLSLGIKKGDAVMLIMKRHYEWWYCMMALHKMVPLQYLRQTSF